MRTYYVYILTNRTYTVLYTGVTSDLERRVWQHKTKATPGFTSRYHVSLLVYYETTSDVFAALEREKAIKKMSRNAKNALIESLNPSWVDISEALCPQPHQTPCWLPPTRSDNVADSPRPGVDAKLVSCKPTSGSTTPSTSS
jgi:putative endonuclease